jgi:hypothetical protein
VCKGSSSWWIVAASCVKQEERRRIIVDCTSWEGKESSERQDWGSGRGRVAAAWERV